jgi:hypothetical protein
MISPPDGFTLFAFLAGYGLGMVTAATITIATIAPKWLRLRKQRRDAGR